jgi:hypothetical protein
MPGFLETLEIAEEGVTGSVDFLKGNLYQKIVSTATVRFETWFNCLVDEEITFADPSMRTSDWIRDDTIGTRFSEFNVGDEIEVSLANTGGNDGSYLISEKLNDYQIRVTDTLGAAVTLSLDLLDPTAKFLLKQDPQGFTFDYGLIENSEATNFNSKVDGNIMRYEYAVPSGSTTIPNSATAMSAVGMKDWQLGTVTIEQTSVGSDRDNGLYRYEIVHTFYIHPFYLHQQILDYTATFPKAPNYFRYGNCLKYVFRARGLRELTDPNVFQELVFDEKDGNTGWENEEYNGGTPEFEIRNLAYSNSLGLTRDDSVTVTFDIYELGTNQAQLLGLNFILLPENETQYKNRNELMLENYCFDRAYTTVGATAVNGENFGTGYDVFKTVTLVNNTGYASVSAVVDFGANVQAKIDTLTNKQYSIRAYTATAGLTESTVNYVTLPVDIKAIQVEIPDATVAVTNQVLFHDQNDNSTVQASPIIKVEDEIVIDSLLELDRSSLDIQIENINCEIIATDGSEVVTLETLQFDLSQQPLIGGVRFISQTIQDSFKVNSSEIRKEYKCYRSVSQDVGSVFAYRLQYPFLFRWEYWEQLFLNSPLPSDLYDVNQNFNGYNQDWIRLGSISGWDIKYRVRTNVAVNQTLAEKITDETLVEKDYLGNSSEWDNPYLRTFDGATALTYSSNPYIMTNKRTKVEIEWEYLGADPIDETDVYMVARIIPKEGGTYIQNDSFSSVWDREGLGMFTSNDGSSAGNGLITIAHNAGIFTGTLYIDHTKLPLGVNDFTISWSINRDTATSKPDWGDVATQDVKALEVIIPDPEIELEENPFKLCCLPIKVFAATTGTDTYKNDFYSPLKAFPLQYTVTMYLEKYNPVTDTWSSVATLANQVSRTKNNLTYYGHKIEWQTYLNTPTTGAGEGKYRVNFDYGTSSIYSEEFCLYKYSQDAVNKTVRFEYTWDSVIGDKSQSKTRDFAGMDWTSQLRICDSVFYGRRGGFEKETQRLETGEELSVKKSFREEYTLEMRKAGMAVHKFLMYDVLMADEILVCDYNSENADAFVDLSVEINSGYEPNYEGSRPYPSVEVTFIDKFNQRRKLYS